jgi:hypothetical protein
VGGSGTRPTCNNFRCGFECTPENIDCGNLNCLPQGSCCSDAECGPCSFCTVGSCQNVCSATQVCNPTTNACEATPLDTDVTAACPGVTTGGFRDCGYSVAPGFPRTCLQGETISVDCGCTIPENCSGDPVMRLCEGSTGCTVAVALDQKDDTCGRCPQVTATCPPSGVYTVLVGAFQAGEAFGCSP